MKITALYERLSHDDEVEGESHFIVNQVALGVIYPVFCFFGKRILDCLNELSISL